jgi:hypothetical protein
MQVSLGETPIAVATLTHDGGTETGQAEIAATNVAFTPDGLQLEDLTPLVGENMARASGTASFTGAFGWSPAGATSRGVFSTPGLDFRSPAGPVTGVKGEIVFTSLTPLVSAPDQKLEAATLQALLPLTDLEAVFDLGPAGLQLDSATAVAADGTVALEPMLVPFEQGATLTGAVALSRVNLNEVFEATNLGDKVKLDAVVTGRVPFSIGPQGFRLANGSFASVQPGRLSIDRDALTGIGASAAEGAQAPEAPVNAVQDFAYQALENLAFDNLDAQVESRPGGRLGVIFKIKGRHDPPVAEEARVSIMDVIRGQAFQKRIPLPKGTPINLTLDTSLNFDELLAAFARINQERAGPAGDETPRSEPVQP